MDKQSYALRMSKSLEVATGTLGTYKCPLCLSEFCVQNTAKLTWDHYPPRSCGGRRKTLVCCKCQKAWNDIDEEVTSFRELKQFERQNPGAFPAVFSAGGILPRVAIRREGNTLYIFGRSDICQDEAVKHWTQWLEEHSQDGRFELRPDKRLAADGWRVQVSLLKAAYLAAFVCLGYPYILAPALEPVRKQLAQPATRCLENFVVPVDDSEAKPLTQFGLVHEPAKAHSLAVFFTGFRFPTGWLAFLPAPARPQLDYDDLPSVLGAAGGIRLVLFAPQARFRLQRSLVVVGEDGVEHALSLVDDINQENGELRS